MNENTQKIREAVNSLNNSTFGALVADLMKRKPELSRAEAICQTVQAYPEAHAAWLASQGATIEGREKNNVNSTFTGSKLGEAAKVLLDDGKVKTMGEAIAHVAQKRPDFVDEYLTKQAGQ